MKLSYVFDHESSRSAFCVHDFELAICIFLTFMRIRREFLVNCVQDKVIPDYYLSKIEKDIDNYANLMLSTNAHLRKEKP